MSVPSDHELPEGGPHLAAPASPSLIDRLSACALAAVFVMLVYRAATQAITYDEALTWRSHGGGPYAQPWGSGVNNHILFTQLARMSTSLFGLSEFSLRLPTLFAALLFLRSAWVLCAGAFAAPALRVCALALLVLNPYTLDYFAAARGYGLGIAFVVWSFAELQAWCSDRRTARLLRAGAAAGLTVAAQLTFGPFVVALVGALAAWELLAGPPGTDRDGSGAELGTRARLRRTLGTLALFGVAGIVAGVPLVAILMRELVVNFFGGVDSLAVTGTQLAESSLIHVRDHFVAGGRPVWVRVLLQLSIAWVLPALFVLVCVAWCSLAWRAIRTGCRFSPSERLLFLAGGVAWMAPALLAILAWGMPLLGKQFVLPGGRRCVWFLPVFTLAVAALADVLLTAGARAHAGRLSGSLGRVVLLVLALGAGRFAYQLQVSYFYDWRYDAGSRRIFTRVQEHWAARGPEREGNPRIRLGVMPWLYECSLNYYRDLEAPDSMWPITPDFDGSLGYDYIVLEPAIDPEVAAQHAEIVFRDPVSHVWLLAPFPREE